MVSEEIVKRFCKETDPKLVIKFLGFHEENPRVYEKFCVCAHRIKNKRTRYSAWAIINVIRWETDLGSDTEPFKISNDYIALYARLLTYQDAKFEGFFLLKEMKKNNRRFSDA